MNEPRMQVIREMTVRVHTLKQAQAAELAGAARHREAGDYTRAAIAEHAAHVNARMAVIYQEVAGILSGTWLPSPDDVSEPPEGNGLGVRVGIVAWAPPGDATPAQLHRWREFCDELHQTGIRQKYRTDDLIPAAHATQVTGRLAPEDIPAPDALTASPAEETGMHKVPAGFGPPRVAVVEGTSGTGAARIAVEPPEHDAKPARDPKPDTARRGIRRIARGKAKTPDGGVGDVLAQLEESRAYPDQPANGGVVEQERADDPSALMVDGEITQAFPAPVAPLIDPDCRDGKCGSCVGGACGHSCHQSGGAS